MKPELIRQRAYSYLRFAEASKDLKNAARLRNMGGEYLEMADLAEEDNSRRRHAAGFTARRQVKRRAINTRGN
jgi:hypothetical protein